MRDIASLIDLRGRTALITGGAGHIGRAAAAALAELGAYVVLADLAAAGPEAAAKSIGANCVGFACDLSDSAAIHAIPDRLKEFGKGLDILVNSAALVGTSALDGWAVPFAEQGEAAWRKALDVNLTGPFLAIQTLAPMLRASGHGAIVNIASIYGIAAPDWSLYEGTSIGNPAAYATSKAGLLQLTRWLATALAPDIRVNAMTPGGIARGQDKQFVERYERGTPLGRMGKEEDMKGAIAYLGSDLSAYVTGQNLVIDGGWTVK